MAEKNKFTHYLPYLGIALTLVIVGAIILASRQQFRRSIREQITNRDGEILAAVVQMLRAGEADEDDLSAPFSDPANQMTVLLKASRIKGMIATRLFDADGAFVGSFPANVAEADLSSRDLPALGALRPVSHFEPSARLGDYFIDTIPVSEAKRLALLVVNVPLHEPPDRRLLGVAQFVIDGADIAGEFATLDRHLSRQTLIAAILGGGAILAILIWAFRQLTRSNRLLQASTASLLRANQELSLAARTSAVGAVTAHLLHGLKNPLSGLHNFVARPPGEGADVADWQAAAASTRRMRLMIDEVVRLVRDEQSGAQYELTVDETVEILTAKIQPLAGEAGLDLHVASHARSVLSNHQANLVLLILENLLHNAVQATPRGKTVQLEVTARDDRLRFAVHDQGPGIPEELRSNLFAPCQSTKEGGTGIGLAISHQLAKNLGAELRLEQSTPQGCVFVLSMRIN